MISLNVVIYDESNVADRCIKSARPYVDEVVIMVDRGCRFTDRLMKYADKLVIDSLEGSIVEHHRNKLIEASGGDWILVLDPDEFITPALGLDLQTMASDDTKLFDKGVEGWYIPRYNVIYDDEYELQVGADFPDWNLRFLRSKGRYGGTIYEDQVSLSTIEKPLGLDSVINYEGHGLIIHDKTYEDIEEVRRTRELYKKWEG